MDQLSLDNIGNALEQLTWISILDILLVTAVIYGGFLLIRGTRAVQVLRAYVVVAIIILLLSSITGLFAFRWMVNVIFPIMLLSIGAVGSFLQIFSNLVGHKAEEAKHKVEG